MEHSKLIKAFSKQIRALKTDAFTEDHLEGFYQMIIDQIRQDIKEGYRDTIARNLTLGIGIHAGQYPKHLILNGEEGGWKYITRFLLWQQYVLNSLFSYKEVASRSVGGIIGLSLLWDMTDLAQLSRGYFQLLFEEDKARYAKRETHHLFMAILYDLHVSGAINHELYSILPEENLYRRFLDKWNSGDKELLTTLLSDICDFHIYSALDLKNKFTEILSLDYTPYEIRLIELIRSKQGLGTIDFKHPLMETLLAKIPNKKYAWDLDRDEVYQYLLKSAEV